MFSIIFQKPKQMTYEEDLSVLPPKSYKFSKNLFFIPLLHSEIAQASCSYPVLIAKTEEGIYPVSLLSFKVDTNSFVDEDGNWEDEKYIPAFLKTYPFIVTAPKWNEPSRVLYDEAYEGINTVAAGSIQIIKDGKLTEEGIKVLDNIKKHYITFETTRELFQELDTLGLLREINVTLASKELNKNHRMKGLYQIDREKLECLTEETLLKLVKNGMLSLIYFHIASLKNVDKLQNRL
jgi:hypothetical protein